MTWEQQAGSVVSPGNGVRAWPLPTLHGPGSSGMCLRVLAVGSSHEDGLRTGPLGPCASQGFRETGTVGWGRCRDPTPRPEPVMQRTHGGACSKWGGKSLRPCLVLAAHTRVKARAVVTYLHEGCSPSPGPRVCTHCLPPSQAQRQAPQAGLAVCQPAPAQLGQHGEGAAVTRLRTRTNVLSAAQPAPPPPPCPPWEPHGAGAVSWRTGPGDLGDPATHGPGRRWP